MLLLMDGYLLVYALGGQYVNGLIRKQFPRVSPVATFLAFIITAGMLPLIASSVMMVSRSINEPDVPILGCFLAGVWPLQGKGYMGVHLLFILAAAAVGVSLNRRGIQTWWGDLRGLGCVTTEPTDVAGHAAEPG